MKRTTLNLVRGNGLLYPLHDSDYETLFLLGIPLNNMRADFVPSLLLHLPKNIKAEIHQFADLEEAMLARFDAKWKYEVSLNAKHIVLTYPKTINQKHLDKAIASLKKWYAGHFYTLEHTEKRAGSKELKSILTKKFSPTRITDPH